jgi:transketolase
MLHKRILEISNKYNLSHRGSCLTAVDIIDQIYAEKKEDEPFILSCGHAGLALYVVLEKYYEINADYLYLKHGTHPNKDLDDKIYCSTGSLGQGLPIALGMALADRTKNVYCLISDGEAFEGTTWEAANLIHKLRLTNLKLYCNYNGWSAYDYVGSEFINRLKSIFPEINIVNTFVEDYGFIGLEAHYITE